jgi:hypothetical protein
VSGNALPTSSLETNTATSVLLMQNHNKMCMDPRSLTRNMSLVDNAGTGGLDGYCESTVRHVYRALSRPRLGPGIHIFKLPHTVDV